MRGSEKTLVLKPPTQAVAIPWTTWIILIGQKKSEP
jgi:hypothetical protein